MTGTVYRGEYGVKERLEGIIFGVEDTPSERGQRRMTEILSLNQQETVKDVH